MLNQEAHAEVVALQMAGEKALNCTAYVSLEPCNHVGRQPPCTHALLRHGVRRVVIGVVDPDPRVSGSGIQFLKEHNIEICVGVERQLCLDTNAAFIHRILHRRPLSVVAIGVQEATSEEISCGGILADCEIHSDYAASPLSWVRTMSETAPDADTVLLDAHSSQALLRHLDTAADDSLPRHLTVLSVLNSEEDCLELTHGISAVSK